MESATAPHRSHLWVYILIAAVVAAATAVTLILTLGGNGYPDTPSGILQRDGYTVIKTMDHQQLANEAGTDADSSIQLAWMDSVAYGTKPGSMEAVTKLTTAGKGVMGLLVPVLQATGADVKIEGDYLIISGSPDQFGGVESDLGGGSTSMPAPSPSGTPAALGNPVAVLG